MIVIGLFFFILEQMLEIITIQLRAFLEAQHKVVKDIIFSLIEQVARRWRPVECGCVAGARLRVSGNWQLHQHNALGPFFIADPTFLDET